MFALVLIKPPRKSLLAPRNLVFDTDNKVPPKILVFEPSSTIVFETLVCIAVIKTFAPLSRVFPSP